MRSAVPFFSHLPPMDAPIGRRRLLLLGSSLGLGACASAPVPSPHPEALQVAHSAGQEVPGFDLPAGACDCHHHLYDHRYPAHPSATLLPADASLADYQRLQRRLGLQRQVIVQPSTYGTDNRLLLDSLHQAGPSARGVAVLDLDTPDAELQRLHAAGVRGVRFNLSFLVGVRAEIMAPLARRLAPLGWHLQVNGSADLLLQHQAVLGQLACPMVVDHMGQLPQPAGIRHPAFALYRRWLDSGRVWFKLSGPYITSRRADFSDLDELAAALLAQAPERLVWGSDWPHPTLKADEKADDAHLLDLLARWAPAAALRRRILVDNPARLYDFPSV